jgi:hypothetical protein
MTYESMTNYKVEVLTADEFNSLFHKLYTYDYDKHNYNVDLKDKINYFDYDDMNWSYSRTGEYQKTLRLITAYNKTDILGICKFAYWDSSKSYSVSYLSTNKDYFKMGISKKLLDVLFKYFSETYPNETMGWSGYSVDGWKYLRPTILEMSKKYNVKIREKAIEYIKNWDDEKRELFDKSREEIKKLYPDSYGY